MNRQDIPYDAIAKFLKGKCNADESAFVESWIKQSVSNQILFENLKREWVFIHDPETVFPEKEDTWEKIQELTFSEKSMPGRRSFRRWKTIGIAASILWVIGFAFSTILFLQNRKQEAALAEQITVITAPPGQKTQMVLPDGTKVWLNSGSKLSYSGNFNQKQREVTLEGQGFFDVTRNEKKKFIVHTDLIQVSVLGTAFDVEAYPEDQELTVSLLRGKVALESSRDNQYLGELNPNQTVVISKQNLQCTWSNQTAENLDAWTYNQLNFYRADLSEIIPKLERWYGVRIDYSGLDRNQKYSFSVKTESLRELLNLLTQIMPIDYSIDGKEVKITKR